MVFKPKVAEMELLNIHVHSFTFKQVPRRFVPCQGPVLATVGRFPALACLLPERLRVFLLRGNRASQRSVLETLAGYYPSGSCFAVHSMDFEYMGAGKMARGYGFLEQLEELAALKADPDWANRLFPFIMADPRRPGLLPLIRHYIEEKRFSGIKLYPPLGYAPTDSRLDAVWEWAASAKIPIMTHCSRVGQVCGRGWHCSKKKLDAYTSPVAYLPVLQKYPELKICFAHYGGERDCMEFYKGYREGKLDDNWFSQVNALLKRYPNTYTDISYTTADSDLMALFHVYAQGESPAPLYSLKDKILFGSDYYMAQMARNERWFSINVRSCMGEDTFWRMIENNWRFLGR